MPLRLKSLELQGYKTFASRTVFEFAEGITAIVGPNGSGKSNIADALRWVLGEQSYLLLRGKKTEDMIFNGSESRPRAGMASTSIVFDNTRGWLPLEFSEVGLARRAYRDGRNEYLLNGQHVRLREVNELLSQSGLSERTYTILGQGLVDASLALRAEDRRRLFEEAAGIGLYRARREEALRRLETTRRNLDRVLDILAELEPRLKSLEKQARRAREYGQIQSDLKALLREWYGYHWHHAQQELAESRSAAKAQEIRLGEARENFQKFLENVSESRQQLAELRSRISDWSRQAAELLAQRESTSRELAVLEERRRSLAEARGQSLAEQYRLEDERRAQAESLAEAAAEADRLGLELEDAHGREQEARSALSQHQAQREEVEQKLQSARRELSDLTSQKAREQARFDELNARIESQGVRLASADAAIAEAESAAQRATEQSAKAASARGEAETVALSAGKEVASARQGIQNLEAGRRARMDERSAREAESARLSAQLDVLEQAEQSLAGLADGARALLEAARESRLTGAHGALSAALDVPSELETALGAALGDRLDAVLLAGGESVEEALKLLESDSAGRAALLPLEWLAAAAPLTAPRDEACLGVASALVSAPPEIRPAVEMLLGQTLVVRDRGSARRLLRETGAQRVVTLRGEVFRADGLVLAGKENRSAALGRPRQKRELQASAASLRVEISGLEQTLDELATEHARAQQELDQAESRLNAAERRRSDARTQAEQTALVAAAARRQAEWQNAQKEALRTEQAQAEASRAHLELSLGQIEGQLAASQEDLRRANGELASLDLQEFTDQVTFWNTRAQVAERALGEAKRRLDERREAAERLEVQAGGLGLRINQIDETVTALETDWTSLTGREVELNRQLTEVRGQADPAERALDAAERNGAALEANETSAQRALQAVERQNSQLQLDLARKQEAVESLRRRIEDDFGLVQFEYEVAMEGAVPLPLGELVETLPAVTALGPDTEENLMQKKAQLRRMGAINLEARQEYDETLERFNNMSAQIEDLREAETDLRQVIAELDELTRIEFTRTFEAVAGHFREIFVRLFGGGSARLVLTDPENLTDTGIDIEARLPGRREQGLAALSGGERSLTAIALVFALLKVAATPLCVMDEVDAMLDEANVGRFRDLLVELSQDTQFIIITHNRNTVQAADVIYGVTMGRDSASQVISLKLDEITEEMLER
jgi:chromosome segregation protein